MTANAKGRGSSKDPSSGSTLGKMDNGYRLDRTDDESEATEDEPAAASGPGQRQQGKPYGYQWTWDGTAKDYIYTLEDGYRLLYTFYQRAGGDTEKCIELQSKATQKSPSRPGSSDGESESDEAASRAREQWRARKKWAKESEQHAQIAPLNQQNLALKRPVIVSSTPPLNLPMPPPPPPPRPPSLERVKKHFEEALDPGFDTVKQPKRFFTVGRIFKTVWFEPYGVDAPARPSDLDWTDDCEPFYGTKPMAKFRWFVVVRKRLNHSLCFSITTFGGPGSAAKTRRGRAVDFVVLHSAELHPPKPYDEEQITRDPLGMIIEDGDQFISPYARLDCGRIYTVEDNLKVMKIGRIHGDSLPLLQQYFRESVA